MSEKLEFRNIGACIMKWNALTDNFSNPFYLHILKERSVAVVRIANKRYSKLNMNNKFGAEIHSSCFLVAQI